MACAALERWKKGQASLKIKNCDHLTRGQKYDAWELEHATRER
jgi:hypothetical protein